MRRDRRPGGVRRAPGSLDVQVGSGAVAQVAVVAAVAGLGAVRAGSGPLAAAGWGLAAVAALLLSVLVHEGGHLLAARAYGVHVLRMRITGALQAAVVRQRTRDRATEIGIALAGPAGTLILVGAGAAAAFAAHGWVAHVGWTLALINAVVFVLSLPPLPGTDGAQAWQARRLGRQPPGAGPAVAHSNGLRADQPPESRTRGARPPVRPRYR